MLDGGAGVATARLLWVPRASSVEEVWKKTCEVGLAGAMLDKKRLPKKVESAIMRQEEVQRHFELQHL